MSPRVNCKGMTVDLFQMRRVGYQIAEANAKYLERRAFHNHAVSKNVRIHVMTKLIILC